MNWSISTQIAATLLAIAAAVTGSSTAKALCGSSAYTSYTQLGFRSLPASGSDMTVSNGDTVYIGIVQLNAYLGGSGPQIAACRVTSGGSRTWWFGYNTSSGSSLTSMSDDLFFELDDDDTNVVVLRPGDSFTCTQPIFPPYLSGPTGLAYNGHSFAIDGLGGADEIEGGIGTDEICGGTGRDVLDGRDGNDEVDGWTHGDLILSPHGGYDVYYGYTGGDIIWDQEDEGAGDLDFLFGESGADCLEVESDYSELDCGSDSDARGPVALTNPVTSCETPRASCSTWGLSD